MSIRYERRREKYDAMCNTIDELRAQIAAVNAALDQFNDDARYSSYKETAYLCIVAVRKAVGR